MPRKGARRRIAKGVYEDRTGISAIYRDRAGDQRELRFPHDTTISAIRKAVEEKKRTDGSRHGPKGGTLAAAVERWTTLEQHLASWVERRSELRAWVALYGDKSLGAITRADVQQALSRWARASLKPKTLRNRLWTLRHLYHVLHGSKAETPCDDVKPPAKVRRVPVRVPPDIILAVYARLVDFERTGRLRNAKTRARFMVRASTGRRPSEIMCATADDVDFTRRTWRVRDGKGGWTPGGVFLNDDMLEAWRVFAEANAWGPFNTGSQSEVIRAAGWPGDSRPYDMRASTGIDMSEAGIDLQDVGASLGHTAVQTTRSNYVPVLNSRMKRASDALAGRLGGWKVLAPATGTDDKLP